jgi:ABC-2 type transport system permease protein
VSTIDPTAGRPSPPGRTGRTAAAATPFAPRPGAAPLHRMVLAQARMEARLMLRNGEQLLLAVVIPVIVLIGGVLGSEHVSLSLDHPAIDVFTPGVLALAVMSTAFTSLAIATGFERRYGVIKRLGSSPLPRSGLLAGKVGALLLVEALQVAVICAVAAPFDWDPAGGVGAVVGAVLAVVAGTAAFAALGLLVAGVLRAEATLAAANLVYLLLMAGGAVVLPASAYGGFGEVVRWLPSGALGDAMRAALIDGRTSWSDLAVLVVWAAVGTALTARTFKWE